MLLSEGVTCRQWWEWLDDVPRDSSSWQLPWSSLWCSWRHVILWKIYREWSGLWSCSSSNGSCWVYLSLCTMEVLVIAVNHAAKYALWSSMISIWWVSGCLVQESPLRLPVFQNLWATTLSFVYRWCMKMFQCMTWYEDVAVYELIVIFLRLIKRLVVSSIISSDWDWGWDCRYFSRRGSRMNHIGNTLMRCWRSYQNVLLHQVKQLSRPRVWRGRKAWWRCAVRRFAGWKWWSWCETISSFRLLSWSRWFGDWSARCGVSVGGIVGASVGVFVGAFVGE